MEKYSPVCGLQLRADRQSRELLQLTHGHKSEARVQVRKLVYRSDVQSYHNITHNMHT